MGDLIDTGMVQDIYSDGIARLEIIGNQCRFIMFSWQLICGRPERVVVAKIVRPLSSIPMDLKLFAPQVVRLDAPASLRLHA